MRIAALLALAAVAAPAWACPGLEVADGWIREAPPGSTVTAGYARLRNAGKAALAVSGARSAAFEGAMLHRTVTEDGVSRMVHGGVLALAPGESKNLEPGGWHLMLVRPLRPLKAGERVTVALECGGAASEFPFTVKAAP